MKTRYGMVLAVVIALAVGAAAGWFAASAWREEKCLPAVALAKAGGNVETANAGRADGPDGRAVSMKPPKPPSAPAPATPRRKANVDVRPAPEAAKPEEKPVQEEQPEQKNDNERFARYLDMFKNDPGALVAEFLKEADADRARQMEIRKYTIDNLKLDAEQRAVFENALDELQATIKRQQQDAVDLIVEGYLNEDTAADGSIWSSNPLLMRRSMAARESAIQETAEKLYEQLELDGIGDAAKQSYILNAVNRTSFSYECLEPYLSVYDKIYKNMGVGEGVFSWCARQRPVPIK